MSEFGKKVSPKHKLFRLGATEKEILKMVGLGLVVAAAFVAPNIAQILVPLKKDRNRYKKVLKTLEGKELILLSGDKVAISEKGQKLLQNMDIEAIGLKQTEWDGIWHVIVYDVPNYLNKQRDYFRGVLKRLGFVKIQKSMWAIPWECKEEVAVIAYNLKISSYVVHLNTDQLPKQDELMKNFELTDLE